MSEGVQLACPHCGQMLRLKPKGNGFGEEVEVKCGSCNQTFRTTIPHDLQRLGPILENLSIVLRDAVAADPRVGSLMEEIAQIGYAPILAMSGTIHLVKREDDESSRSKGEPLVQDGEVSPRAFSAQDDDWLRTHCNITLEEGKK